MPNPETTTLIAVVSVYGLTFFTVCAPDNKLPNQGPLGTTGNQFRESQTLNADSIT